MEAYIAVGGTMKFLSTPSARRATVIAFSYAILQEFLSTPSARRATHRHHEPRHSDSISIHALREEGDSSLRGKDDAVV